MLNLPELPAPLDISGYGEAKTARLYAKLAVREIDKVSRVSRQALRLATTAGTVAACIAVIEIGRAALGWTRR